MVCFLSQLSIHSRVHRVGEAKTQTDHRGKIIAKCHPIWCVLSLFEYNQTL